AVRLWSLSGSRVTRGVLRAALLPLLPAALVLWTFGGPARVLQARIGGDEDRIPTLNAFVWLGEREEYRADAAALAWIREHVPPGERIAEAPSQSGYSYQGRVASLAGRPIPLGWGHHEAQWRGPAIYESLALRDEMVRRIFQAGDAKGMSEAADALEIR